MMANLYTALATIPFVATPVLSAHHISSPLHISQNAQLSWLDWIDKIDPLLSPLAIIFSATIAGWYALLTIRANRKINQKRATFEHLSRLRWDRDFMQSRETYLRYKVGDTKLRKVAETYHKYQKNPPKDESEHQDAIKEYNAITNLLNEYESIAIGIATGALDEEIIKRTRASTIIDTIKTCDEFITKAREHTKNERIYCECQAMIKRWQDEARQSDNKARITN